MDCLLPFGYPPLLGRNINTNTFWQWNIILIYPQNETCLGYCFHGSVLITWQLFCVLRNLWNLLTSSSLVCRQGKENVNPTGSFLSLICCFSIKSPRHSATWSKSCKKNIKPPWSEIQLQGEECFKLHMKTALSEGKGENRSPDFKRCINGIAMKLLSSRVYRHLNN